MDKVFAFAIIGTLLAQGVGHAQDVSTAAQIGLKIGPETTVISEPIDRHGYPNYVRALDAKLAKGVARKDNFWAGMWQAAGNVELSSDDYISAVEQRLGIKIDRQRKIQLLDRTGFETQGEAMSRPWTRDEFPAIAQWIDANANVLTQVSEAARRPQAYGPLVSTGDGSELLIAVLLPHVQYSREFVRLYNARAMLRLAEGDSEGAWDDLVTCFHIARHVEDGWTLIEGLVGAALRSMTAQPLAHWMSQPQLSADELEERLKELAPLLKSRSLAEHVDTSERYMYIDMVLAMMSHRANSQEVMSLTGVTVVAQQDSEEAATFGALNQFREGREIMLRLILAGADVNATLRYGNRIYDDLAAAMSAETHAQRAAQLALVTKNTDSDAALVKNTGGLVAAYLLSSKEEFQMLPGRVLAGTLTPAIAQVEKVQTRTDARSAVISAAFRVVISLDQSGDLPTSIAAMKDAASLVDPYNGEPLRMVIDHRGVVIYCVGDDGEDDNGATFGEGDGMDDVRVILRIAP